MKWFSRIYPMIHLQGDESEAVGYHYDKIGKDKFFTLWSPITNYNYPALSYVKYSEKLPKSAKEKGLTTFRTLTISGQEIEFSKGFTDLHTLSYQKIIEGKGYGLKDARHSIEIVSKIRNKEL